MNFLTSFIINKTMATIKNSHMSQMVRLITSPSRNRAINTMISVSKNPITNIIALCLIKNHY